MSAPNRSSRAGSARPSKPRPVPARRVALDALIRIERDGAYANLVLPAVLARSGLDERDRGFVTELVYGVTRMRRSLDWLVDRFVNRDPDPETRAVLRLGAYQLVWLGTPPHAAVSATVAVAPPRTKGLVNAVLRRVSEADRDWPDEATRLSYPDWIIERLTTDLGPEVAVAALESMNEAASAVERADGYRQDTASQWVTEVVGAEAGQRVVDLCAGPGGKATGLATGGAAVLALELHPARAGLVLDNARHLRSAHLNVVAADGRAAPVRPGMADRVLVDAPCSGLGSLRRRARCPLADRPRRRRAPGPAATPAARRRRRPGPSRGRDRVLHLHPDGGRDHRCRCLGCRRPPRPGGADPGGTGPARRVRAPRTRGAGVASGRWDRRHVRVAPAPPGRSH